MPFAPPVIIAVLPPILSTLKSIVQSTKVDAQGMKAEFRCVCAEGVTMYNQMLSVYTICLEVPLERTYIQSDNVQAENLAHDSEPKYLEPSPTISSLH